MRRIGFFVACVLIVALVGSLMGIGLAQAIGWPTGGITDRYFRGNIGAPEPEGQTVNREKKTKSIWTRAPTRKVYEPEYPWTWWIVT
jgi:hypothetical protein